VETAKVQNKIDYPYIWNSDGSDSSRFHAFRQDNAAEIDAVLLKHGAILFRGFNIDSAEKMRSCIDAFPGNSLRYVDGNSPRTHLKEAVYTSTEYPPELYISMHSELSYAHRWPSHLYFCCAVEPQQGGNTLVASNRDILRDLPADLVGLFKKKGIKYVRNLHNDSGVKIGQSWRATYETSDKSVVEQHCRDNDIQFEWKADGSLRTIQIRKAVVEHPVTGDEVWFNQADQFHPSTNPPEIYEVIMELFGDNPLDMPHYACFADDSPIETDVLETVREVARKNTVYFPWKAGDFLMVDNLLVSHGRAPFSGPRKILVAMSG
jgi:alpha-ketoglutarate-dependent taurine dioxygenase